jgi:hypothetical protein
MNERGRRWRRMRRIGQMNEGGEGKGKKHATRKEHGWMEG